MPASACSGSKRASTRRRSERSRAASALSPRRTASSSRSSEPAARLEIDWHAEKARRGLREDLGETGRILGVVSGDHVLTPRTLEQDDRLDRVGVDAAPR